MIRAVLEFNGKDSSLSIRCEQANLDEWRKVKKKDSEKFNQWIDSYRHALESHSQNNRQVLFRLGQGIYDWLNGEKRRGQARKNKKRWQTNSWDSGLIVLKST